MKIPGNQIQDYIQPIGLAALCLEFAYNASELDCYRSKKLQSDVIEKRDLNAWRIKHQLIPATLENQIVLMQI